MPNKRGGIVLPAGGAEDTGTAGIGLLGPWCFAEPESEEVTSSGPVSIRAFFFGTFGSVSSVSSLVD